MIRPCGLHDFEKIYTIINDSAAAYKGIIPEDRWHEPYMPKEELRHEIEAGVVFWGYEEGGELIGVMGIQDVQDVTLIRHAYVLPESQGKGIGTRLLDHLKQITTTRKLLVGTWADAIWAVAYYRTKGFNLMPDKDGLLTRYWNISRRQIETSVVLGIDL